MACPWPTRPKIHPEPQEKPSCDHSTTPRTHCLDSSNHFLGFNQLAFRTSNSADRLTRFFLKTPSQQRPTSFCSARSVFADFYQLLASYIHQFISSKEQIQSSGHACFSLVKERCGKQSEEGHPSHRCRNRSKISFNSVEAIATTDREVRTGRRRQQVVALGPDQWS